jgi:hypothetical protein
VPTREAIVKIEFITSRRVQALSVWPPLAQAVARLLSPEGAVVGLSYAPSLHGTAS